MKVRVRWRVPEFMPSLVRLVRARSRSEFDAEVLDHRLLLNELAFGSLEKSALVQLIKHEDGVCALIGPDLDQGITGFGKTADEALCSLVWAIEAEHHRRLKEMRESAPHGERRLAWG